MLEACFVFFLFFCLLNIVTGLFGLPNGGGLVTHTPWWYQRFRDYAAVWSLGIHLIKHAWMFEMNFGGYPPTNLPTPALFSAPSSSLSNYIITFPSIKIQMNNLNVWLWETRFRGCLWWAMHAKVTLLWQKEEIIHQKFNILRRNFKSVTQKHAGRYEIWKKAAAGGSTRLVCKHLSVRLLPKFNLSQRLFHPRACSGVCVQDGGVNYRENQPFTDLWHTWGSLTASEDEPEMKWCCGASNTNLNPSLSKESTRPKTKGKSQPGGGENSCKCQMNHSGTDCCICRQKLLTFSPESPPGFWKSPRSKSSQCRYFDQVNANSEVPGQ